MKETELCSAFTDWVHGSNWTPYPEIDDWDLVLVHPEGFQIGVEAKTQNSLKVVAQALRRPYRGPHVRAVLVPKKSSDLVTVCKHARVLVFSLHEIQIRKPSAQRILDGVAALDEFLWKSPRRIKLPPVVPQHAAGRPSGGGLSEWRVAALKLWARLEDHGFVTSQDFRDLGLSMKTWKGRWLIEAGSIPNPQTGRRVGRWIRNPNPYDPYPVVGYENELLEMRAKGLLNQK